MRQELAWQARRLSHGGALAGRRRLVWPLLPDGAAPFFASGSFAVAPGRADRTSSRAMSSTELKRRRARSLLVDRATSTAAAERQAFDWPPAAGRRPAGWPRRGESGRR